MAIVRTLINWFKGKKMPLNPTTLAVPGVGSFRGINPFFDIVPVTITGAANQPITSRINFVQASDPTGKGMIIIKRRDATGNWFWTNNYTDANVQVGASPNTYFINGDVAAGGIQPAVISAFNATGCTVNNANLVAGNYISYHIRENRNAGWFSTYTYTGQATPITMNPLLGGTDVTRHMPGLIIVKHSDTQNINDIDWYVHHRNLPATRNFRLDSSAAAVTSAVFNNFTPTLTQWQVAGDMNFNTNFYRAFIFADNKMPDGNSCVGTYVGNGNIIGPEQTCGWKPDFIAIKGDQVSDWALFDRPRGIVGTANDGDLKFNVNDIEVFSKDIGITTRGFQIRTTNNIVNALGVNYYWWALRWQDG